MSLTDELKTLVEDGYKIADARNIIGLKKKVYRAHEPGFKDSDNNFGHMAIQEIYAAQYDTWYESVEQTFRKFGLQKSKFRIAADSFDPDTESNLSAQRFLRRLRVLENVLHDNEFRKTFISFSAKPPIIYARGVLSQGDESHNMGSEFAAIFTLLWQYRSIVRSDDTVIREPKPLTRNMVYAKMKIDHDALVRISKGINSIRINKHIMVKLKYPEKVGVYIEATEDTE